MRVCVVVFVLVLAGCSSAIDGHGASSRSGGASSSPAPKQAVAAARFGHAAVVAQVLRAAAADFVATNSYDYRRLDADERAGTAATTGTYRTEYRQGFERVVKPNAQRLHATQQALVDVAGIRTLSVGSGVASVLVFGQVDISTKASSARRDPIAAALELRRVGGRWLLAVLSVNPPKPHGAVPGTAGLHAAFAAARKTAHDLQTFGRASFDADYQRALDDTTGALRSDLAQQKTQTRTTLQRNGTDLAASVIGAGVASADGTTVQVLVLLNGYRVKAGTRQLPTQQRLEITMQRVGAKWLASDVSQRGLR